MWRNVERDTIRGPRAEWKGKDVGDGLDVWKYDKFIRSVRTVGKKGKYTYHNQVFHAGEWHDLHGKFSSINGVRAAAEDAAAQRVQELKALEEWNKGVRNGK